MTKFNKFQSRRDGQQRAKKFHFCLDCRYSQPETWKNCPQCNGMNRQFFPSKTELDRGASLLLQQDQGMISKLRFQPRYPLIVNFQKICVYVADAEYYRDGKLVVEDSKSPEWIDELAKVKIALFQAIFGVTVTIPQRKTGTIQKCP